jgi:hypothetical protein
MKNLLLLCVLCLSMLSATAQNKYKKQTLEERAIKFTKEITDYVSNISPEQNASLLAVNKSVTQQFDSLKALQLASEEYKPAARSIFKNRDAAIKVILNANQFDEFMMLQAEKREAAFKKKNEIKPADSSATSEPKIHKKYFEKNKSIVTKDSLQ